jgi:hypothetical protein
MVLEHPPPIFVRIPPAEFEPLTGCIPEVIVPGAKYS